MSEEKQFVDGVSAKAPHEKAPDFIKARVNIKLADFANYLRELKKAEPEIEWLSIDVKEARSGKWYCERDTWKPQQQAQPEPAPAATPEDDSDPIPF